MKLWRLPLHWRSNLIDLINLPMTTNDYQLLPMTTNALCSKGWHFWKGGIFTDKTGLKIFVFINAMIFAFITFVTNTPLWGKNASKVWKKYSPNISPCFLDAAGGQISDSWFYFHFPLLFHLLQVQLTPFSFIWNICMRKNDGQGWNFHLKYLDVEKMRGKGPKSLMS